MENVIKLDVNQVPGDGTPEDIAAIKESTNKVVGYIYTKNEYRIIENEKLVRF